jgi:hypothetical protein
MSTDEVDQIKTESWNKMLVYEEISQFKEDEEVLETTFSE